MSGADFGKQQTQRVALTSESGNVDFFTLSPPKARTVDDFEIPNDLLARCAGQRDLVRRVLSMYVGQMDSDIPELLSKIKNGESDEVAKLAHRMKGASANVVAEDLRAIAADVEKCARESQLENAQDCVEHLEAKWNDYLETTRPFIEAT